MSPFLQDRHVRVVTREGRGATAQGYPRGLPGKRHDPCIRRDRIGIAAGNTLEALAGASLVNRFANGRNAFDRPENVFKWALLAGMISTLVGATFGVTSLCLGGGANWTEYGPIWLTWWLGDMAGVLIVAPLVILWALNPRLPWNRQQFCEAALLLLAVLVVGLIVFGGLLPFGNTMPPLTFLCIPPLVWAAYRFGQREAATAAALLSDEAARARP